MHDPLSSAEASLGSSVSIDGSEYVTFNELAFFQTLSRLFQFAENV